MASVDPYQLLKALSVLLNKDGSIRGEPELTKVLNLMKAARKLVSRCIYINILRATTEKTVLQKFVTSGGWEILNIWLQEAKENENNPFILELIKLFKQIPVTVEILKKTNTAKTIKQFSKGDGDDRLKACSSELVETWMTVIRGSGPTIDKASLAKKKKLKKPISEKEDPPKVKKEEKEEIEEVKDTSNKRTSENKEGSNKKLKTEETDKKSDVTDGTSPSKEDKKSIVKKEPKKENLKPKQSNSKEDDKKEDKKNEEKSEDKEKKTTKTKTRSGPAFAKMRSTGLESNAKLPPVNKKKKPEKAVVKPDLKSTTSIKRDGPLLSKSLTPPDKKVKTEEKTSVERRTSTGIRVKIIPPKPKLQESSGFLEALNAPVTPVRKKVKKQNKTSANNKDQSSSKGVQDGSSKGDKSPATPEDSKPEPPKFNFYSNAEPEEGKDDNSVFGEVLTPDESGKKEDTEESDKKTQGSKSNLKIVPSRKKKSVTWKEDSELVDICYFDLDENERENVNRPKDFRNAAQMEMRNERQTILNAMKGNLGLDPGEEDSNGATGVIETIPWRRPPKLDIIPLVVYGCNSTEKESQAKRERTVLQEIFFSAAMIPDTPKEPDLEAVEYIEPKRIPLEDESSPDPIEPLVGAPGPSFMPPGIGQQPPGGLPPEIANLVNQIPKQKSVGGSGQPGEPSVDKIKEILSTVMSNPSQSGIPQDVDIHSEEFTNKLREIIAPFKGNSQETSNPPPLLQAPPQHPPPLLETGLPPPGSQPPPMYGYGPEHMEQYPDPMGQYPDYGDYPGGPPPEMSLPEESYPPYDGRNPGYGPPFPEEGYQRPPGPGIRFRGPRPMGPRFRGSWGRGRGVKSGNVQKVCYHFTSHRGCRLGNSCHFVHPGVTRPPPRR